MQIILSFLNFSVSFGREKRKKMSLKFYYDLMSQPSRAMHIILKMSGVQFEDCPVALRDGKFERVICLIL